MTLRRLLCFSLLLPFTLSVHATSVPVDVRSMVDRADLIFVNVFCDPGSGAHCPE